MEEVTEKQPNEFLEKEKVSKLMKKYALPCVISLLVGALYNIVDQIFIANAAYLGSFGNAANTVVFPMTVFALAVAVLIGDGCCAFVSLRLGAKQQGDADKGVGNAVTLSVICGIVIAIIYLVFLDGIITAFGAKVNQTTYDFAKEYFFWIAIGIPFYVFGQAMNPVIRSDGSPKFAMVSTLLGAVVNLILDPIFIYLFKWGMMGAAVATVIGQLLTAVLAIWYLFHTKIIKLDKRCFVLNGKVSKGFLRLGLTSFLAQISLVLAMAAMQNMCTKYGALDPVFGQAELAQIPLAVLGIVMKFFQIVISVAIGLAAGCIPVVGYNMGANKKKRVKLLFKYLLIAEGVVGCASLLVVELFPLQLIGIFGASGESVYYTQFAVKSFRIYLCMMALSTVNKGTFIFLQALGKTVASTGLSFLREVVFGVGFALLLPTFFGLDGLLWSFPISDVLTFIVTVAVVVKTMKELSKSDENLINTTEQA